MSQQPSSANRIETLDIVRGFAVFGIFLVNIPEMNGTGSYFISAYTGIDAFIRLLFDLFVQTKFYSIFAFLFGLGFYLFMQSAERRGLRAKTLLTRRLVLLLLVGLAHFILLWYGDILHNYALAGFLLLLFYKRSAKTALIWGSSLMSLFAIFIFFTFAPATGILEELAVPEFIRIPDLGMRIDYLLNVGIPGLFIFSIEITGLFLLGLYAGKKRWLEQYDQHLPVIRRLQWLSLLVSALLFVPMVNYYLTSNEYDINFIFPYTHLSGKTMAVFYLCTLLRLIHRLGTARFGGLAAVGRMALTNYLSQTVITMLIVSLYWNTMNTPLWVGIVYCAVIFTIQVLWSKLWLRYYTMGPLEWLWRAGTYGKLTALRKPKPQSTTRSLGH